MTVQLWKDRTGGVIDPELFSTTAEALARKVNQERLASRDKANKPTQLRKFFDEVNRYKGMTQASPDEFASFLPYIKMLNAKAAYAAGRDLIGATFKDFINDSLKQVQDRKDFELFCAFFEAFLGYYKFCAEKESSQSEHRPASSAQGNRREYVPNQRPQR